MTAVQNNDDPNSLWIIKESDQSEPCITGTPIKCGQGIRLEHADTARNLHSHEYNSFITESIEVNTKDSLILFCRQLALEQMVKETLMTISTCCAKIK